MKNLKVELQTPTNQVFSGEAASVIIPTVDGFIGVLPGHAPLITLIGSGNLQIKNVIQNLIFKIDGGFAEIKSDHINILANNAENI